MGETLPHAWSVAGHRQISPPTNGGGSRKQKTKTQAREHSATIFRAFGDLLGVAEIFVTVEQVGVASVRSGLRREG